MTKRNGKRIMLADVEEPLMPVVLPDGTELEVRVFDAFGYEVLREHTEGGDQLLLYKLAGMALPEATEDQVKHLSGRQIALVIAHASHQHELVEELIAGKGDPAPARKASRSKTRSGTPSAG